MSTRYLWALVALLGLTAVPTSIHGYLGLTVEDGLSTRAIPAVLAGMPGRETGRSAEWIRATYGSTDWIERVHASGSGDELRLFAARTFDAKKIYHHPELGVLRGHDFVRPFRVRLGADVPVTVLRATAKRRGLGLHALLYDGEFVDDPFSFELRLAARHLVSGRRAMTLVLVFDPEAPPGAPLETSLAWQVLREAIEAFAGQETSP